MAKGSATDEAEWGPQRQREDGVFLEGESGLPGNHRLRAEALAAAGKKRDPDGIISDELIADAAKRLKAGAPEIPASAGKGEGKD